MVFGKKQIWSRSCDIFSSWKFDLLFINSKKFVWSLYIHYPHDEIKINRYTFSLVLDVNIEENCFFNAELKILYQQLSIFSAMNPLF